MAQESVNASETSIDGLLLGNYPVVQRKVPSKYRFLTDVGSFNVGQVPEVRGREKKTASFLDFVSKTDAWIEVETYLTGYRARQSAEIVSSIGTSSGGSNVTLVAQTGTYQLIGFPPKVASSALSSPAQAEAADLKQTTLESVAEAKSRLQGHEDLIAHLHSIVEEEAARLNVVINGIVVRPGWSHEDEDSTGVVIEVQITNKNDRRFLLWDAVSSKLDALLDSLQAKEQSFLNDNVSVVVTVG